MKRTGMVLLVLWASLPHVVSGQSAGSSPSLTGDPALDDWVRSTFGQPVDPETLNDPVSGTKTLLALTDAQREGARLFKQRCNVCHGAAMNSSSSYGPPLSKKNVEGREDSARTLIMNGTVRMPAFRHGLQASRVDLIIGYLKTVEKYEGHYPSRLGNVQ